jgi:hypothetical protein
VAHRPNDPPRLRPEQLARILAVLASQEAEVKEYIRMLEPFDGHRIFLELKRLARGTRAYADITPDLAWMLVEVYAGFCDDELGSRPGIVEAQFSPSADPSKVDLDMIVTRRFLAELAELRVAQPGATIEQILEAVLETAVAETSKQDFGAGNSRKN